MLLKNLVTDIHTHGYRNMSVEYCTQDLEGDDKLVTVIIRKFLEDNSVAKSVIYTDESTVFVDNYIGEDRYIGTAKLDLVTFGWSISDVALYLYDETVVHSYDAVIFNLL